MAFKEAEQFLSIFKTMALLSQECRVKYTVYMYICIYIHIYLDLTSYINSNS